MNHADRAVAYFGNNFNCSQSVFTTFAAEMGMDEQLALKLGTNFGGGERKGEVCGAVAGALMVLGLYFGHCDSKDTEGKKRAYRISEEFMDRFIQKNGSVVCRELLGYNLSDKDELQIIRDKGLFRTLCPQMVRSAAEILDEMLMEYLPEAQAKASVSIDK